MLKRTLSQVPHSLSTVVISLDDFYLRHEDQVKLAASHPRNPLVQHRGQPSTHDLDLLMSTLSSLQKREPVKLPQYDKSAFKGAGDRSSSAVWEEVNRPSEDTIEVVILEGWCTAFRALTSSQLQQKWQAAKDAIASGTVDGQLGRIQLEDAAFVNEALKAYEQVWILSDALIHIDAQDTRWVYDWRLEAEVKLRAEKGSGMTDQQVKHFIDGCKCHQHLGSLCRPALTSPRLSCVRVVRRPTPQWCIHRRGPPAEAGA